MPKSTILWILNRETKNYYQNFFAEVKNTILIHVFQVASHELGIPMSMIHIKETSTESVPNTAPTGASVATDLNGMAVAVRFQNQT